MVGVPDFLKAHQEAGYSLIGIEQTQRVYTPFLIAQICTISDTLVTFFIHSTCTISQFSESVSLPQFVFPEKTVLVLGAENSGLPVEILQV